MQNTIKENILKLFSFMNFRYGLVLEKVNFQSPSPVNFQQRYGILIHYFS